jgi:hypothetical protein
VDEAHACCLEGNRLHATMPVCPSRIQRLARLQAARAQIEAEAAEKARKHAEDKEKRRQDRSGAKDPTAVETAGRDAAAKARPKEKAQANFTDPDSRIMKNGDGAYIQAYNAQAQGAGVPVLRWSRTIATACCWLSPEPAANP